MFVLLIPLIHQIKTGLSLSLRLVPPAWAGSHIHSCICHSFIARRPFALHKCDTDVVLSLPLTRSPTTDDQDWHPTLPPVCQKTAQSHSFLLPLLIFFFCTWPRGRGVCGMTISRVYLLLLTQHVCVTEHVSYNLF